MVNLTENSSFTKDVTLAVRWGVELSLRERIRQPSQFDNVSKTMIN